MRERPNEVERVVDWRPPEVARPPGGDGTGTARAPLVATAAGLLLAVLAINALVGWWSDADTRRSAAQAEAVEALFGALNTGDVAAYRAGGLHRVQRAGVTWGFLQRLEDAPGGVTAPPPDGTRVEAGCQPVGAQLVRCSLRQRGGLFDDAGVVTAGHGYFVVTEAGVVRRAWIEIDADSQRAARFLRDLRTWLEAEYPELHRTVYDTELPLLYRRAFQDTLVNRGHLAGVLDEFLAATGDDAGWIGRG